MATLDKVIDLRSDTTTQPTPAMREAMARAPVGDDGYGDDPTINRLEALAAEMVGKEAAVYVVSGVMGNLSSVLGHTDHGDEVIAEIDCHVVNNEVGGVAAIAGCLVKTLRGYRGAIEPAELETVIRDPGSRPRTALVCVENTHNKAGGVTVPIENLRQLKAVCDKKGVPIHLDGARVFNAAAALGVNVKEITKHVDSLMFCLSKGLGAPVGSIVAGSTSFIKEVRQARKMLGGGVRQGGIVAAAGIVALETMVDRLVDDHKNARRLAEGLHALGLPIDMSLVETNMVFINPPAGMTALELQKACYSMNVWARANGGRVRMVTHYQIGEADVQDVIDRFSRARQSGLAGIDGYLSQ